MAYGLQLFNKAGANIMDTNERFTRVYGSYKDIYIYGPMNLYDDSKYCQLTTKYLTVPVSLPATIQRWTPVITSAKAIIEFAAYYPKGNGENQVSYSQGTRTWSPTLPYTAALDFVLYSIIPDNSNVSAAMYEAVCGESPILSAYEGPKGTDGGPTVTLAFTTMHSLSDTNGSIGRTTRSVTCSFSIVGY